MTSIEHDEINMILGEMVGTLRGILIFYKDSLTEHSISQIENLLKRYEEFFKMEKAR